MSVYAPSLPASPSIRPTDVDVRRLFQTPTTSVAGPSSLPAPSASANPSPCPSPGPPSAHPLSSSPHAHTSGHHGRRSQVSRNRFNAELSQCLLDFVVQLLPTTEELRIKEDVRKLLERLIRTIDPNSRLLTFGSSANGFALRNSDMDLCCLIESDPNLSAADLVSMLGDLLERETKFTVKPLPYARIPIVKLSLDPSPGLPQGIACDIGFENKLALENTRLLMCYAMIDPARVRTMVLFLKVWSKRRKINSPYRGTLSSYGYVLMVLYFLTHVKNPPVLPNLQQIPPMRPMPVEDMQLNGNNIWFFDDVELLRQRWQSQNTETVAELLADFFKYYSREFSYNSAVISLRAGAMRKEPKGWQSMTPRGKYEDPRERNRFCIEDPFEIEFNVARCVSKDGLYLIRGELMRAHRVFQGRPDRAIVALAQLCEERQQEELPPLGAVSFIPPRPPPQTPYTVGGSSMRPQVVPAPNAEEPPANPEANGDIAKTLEAQPPANAEAQAGEQPVLPTPSGQALPLPDHMAPRRSQYTSPPPPDAPLADLVSFEDMLGHGLSMATAATEARERERERDQTGETSASASEIFTDDGRISDVADLDDVRSVRSFTEESVSAPQWSPQPPPAHAPAVMAYSYSLDASGGDARKLPGSPLSMSWKPQKGAPSLRVASLRGRRQANGKDEAQDAPSPTASSPLAAADWNSSTSRRSISGPPRALNGHRYSMTAADNFVPVHPMAHHRLPLLYPSPALSTSTVFYETGSPNGSAQDRSPGGESGSNSPITSPASPAAVYAAAAAAANVAGARPYPTMLPYPTPMYPHHLMDPRMYAYSAAAAAAVAASVPAVSPAGPAQYTSWDGAPHEHLGGPKTPTPTPGARRKGSHAHSHSTATVVGEHGSGRLRAPKAERAPKSPGSRKSTAEAPALEGRRRADSPRSIGTDSPAPSSPASSHCVTSPSTSPPSPAALEPKPVPSPSPTPSPAGDTPVMQRRVITLADAGSPENTPVGTSFTHAPPTPS